MNLSTPPAAHEFEISIIGPGRGECVILHLGDNQWCIVDSCRPQGSVEAAAIEYLSSFKNDALAGVKVIVATHWHDDHIQGLASILKRAPSAAFFCSTAIDTGNFFALAATATATFQGTSGVEEFAAILGLIADDATTPREKKLASPKWVVENLNLVQLLQGGRSFPVSITALSPSNGTVKLALNEINKLIPKAGETPRRITSRSLNHTSIVLWVEAGPLRALLGADLEHTGVAGEGWMAVLHCHKSRHQPQPASFIKVPHHGSANADYPDVWTHMLVPKPIAVVTPFNGGPKRLPQPSDLARLAGRTDSLYCTSAGAGKASARDAVVEKTMRLQVKDRRVIEGRAGHVRVRWSLRGKEIKPVVETFNGAYRV